MVAVLMEIRDVIHGTITASKPERLIISAPFFQRLRNIKQLGFGENSFPSATHNRYIHSLGAMHLAGLAFEQAFQVDRGASLATRYPEAFERFRSILRAAALLHDVGHGPLSHTTEFAMPPVNELQLPEFCGSHAEHRRATHEDYTLKIILQSSLTPLIKRAWGYLGIEPHHIAALIDPQLPCPDDFFMVAGVDYRPILCQLISSEIDVDRMDYLTRDSFYCGVSYGKFDLGWLISNLSHHIKDQRCYLALKHKAIYTFDDFLISRFHMFLMVYFHHKCVIFDEMLSRYLKSPDCNYALPADIEDYIFYDDYHLYTHLSKSENPWAKRLYHKDPFEMLVEFHSGIPQSPEFQQEQAQHLADITRGLDEQGTPYILKTTVGEISKYFRDPSTHPIFVNYNLNVAPSRHFPLHQCTDLFERYSQSRSITRIYTPSRTAP